MPQAIAAQPTSTTTPPATCCCCSRSAGAVPTTGAMPTTASPVTVIAAPIATSSRGLTTDRSRSRPALGLRAAQDVARRQLELLLRGDARRRVLLAAEE